MSKQVFQPFEDRLSRDIRNRLSSALARAVEKNEQEAIHETADFFLRQRPAPCYVHYIENRLAKYEGALATLRQGTEDPFWRGLVLWDMELFFEVHEILEHAWYTAKGAEKRVLQAMIRAAGVYIKLEFNYIPQAKKMAAKAAAVLESDRNVLAPYCNPDLLINTLHTINPVPPKLLQGS